MIPEVCAECHLNPPDGSEQLRRLSANENLRLHKRCEDTFIRRRMAEEGISWSTMPRSTAPAPSVEKTIDANGGSPPPPPPPPTRQGGAAQAKAPSPLAIELTRLTKAGGPLTKQISLAADGTLIQDKSACVMFRGTAERVTVAGVDGLGALIEDLTPSQALALGGLRADIPDKVRIATTRALQGGKSRVDLIARTNENIVYDGPAFVLLDFDSKGMPESVRSELARLGGFWPALLTVMPELQGAARLVRSSTSAGLSRSDTGAAIPGSDGVHIYVIAKDGLDAVRFLTTLHERCWLKGLGWKTLGAAAQLLNRSIVDRMVGQSGRLVFEGGPVLVPPLVQDKACRRPVATPGRLLDTSMLRELSIVERARLNELIAKENARLKPAELRETERVIKEKTRELVARTPGMTEKAARAVIIRWREGILLPDIVLPFDDPDLAGVTVGDVLVDPERYVGETLADPLEGVDYGRCCAMIMRRADGTPWIHSFAHGRTVYELRYDAAHVRKAMEAADKGEVVATYALYVAAADIDAMEQAELRQLAKKLTGVGLAAIDAALKAAQQQHAAARAKAFRDWKATSRSDPRPRIKSPLADAPWLPPMGVLNDVIGVVKALRPPGRDINNDAARVRRFGIPGTHSFTSTSANPEAEDGNAQGDEE